MDSAEQLGKVIGTLLAISEQHSNLIQRQNESIKTLTDVVELLSKRLKDLEAWTEVP